MSNELNRIRFQLRELDKALEVLSKKVHSDMEKFGAVNCDELTELVAKIEKLKQQEKNLTEGVALKEIQHEEISDDLANLSDAEKLDRIASDLEKNGVVNCDDLILSDEYIEQIHQQKELKRKQEEAEKNRLILALSEKIPLLVKPHLDKLLLKKKQLVRVDDYGNVDWSLFVKELNYFVDKNIRSKVIVPYGKDNLPLEIVADLIFAYENNTTAKVKNLDDVSPIDFEHQCADLLNKTGWTARVTQASGDQGIDVIATYGNVKAVFQVKKYSKPVGNSAVQEILAGKAFEQAHVAAVVTDSTFTASAKKLANATGVFLLHYSELPDFAEELGLVETE